MMIETKLTALIEPLVTELGYELWGITYRLQGQEGLLCLYVDKPGGVLIVDCERVSRQVGALLDVEAPISRRYRLEVSSPGVPRPLFRPAQYSPYVGKQVHLKLDRLLNGTRKIIGKIEAVTDEYVTVQVEESVLVIPFSQVVKAHLVGE
ncbi:MAG: ribosome maturation factor RimP [Gammaproteobacteria bacterium]|nr:ribosome maturation factor RimP [Gammaproteobacteria bacterium]